MSKLTNLGNIYTQSELKPLPGQEISSTILECTKSGFKGLKVCSILSNTANTEWIEQDDSELVFLVQGAAVLSFELKAEGELKEEKDHTMQKGDYMYIEKGLKHRVKSTSCDAVWIAMHIDDPRELKLCSSSSSSTSSSSIDVSNPSQSKCKDLRRLTCDICQTVFESRNKLMKHINFKLCVNSGDVPQDDLSNCILYAIGGRDRGITLNSCEKLIMNYEGYGTWEAIPAMEYPRGSHACTTVNGKIIALGGGGVESNLAVCEIFDPITNSWNKTSPMGTFRHALTCTSIGQYVYAIGGWIDGSMCSADNERYDMVNDSWEQMAPLPTPRRLLGSAVVGTTSIYAFGGSREDETAWYTAVAECYDIASDSWKKLKDLPVAGQCSACALDDKHIFVFIHGSYVVRYDIKHDDYVRVADLPKKDLFTFQVLPVGRHTIILVGGACSGKSMRGVYAFDTLQMTWKILPDMSQARRRLGACIV